MSAKLNATYNEKNEEGEVINTTSASVEYHFGDNLDEAIELFTSEVVLSLFTQAAVIKAQSQLRAQLKANHDEEAIEAYFTTWKPGVAAPRVAKDPTGTFAKAFEQMSEDEQQAAIAMLQEKAAG